MKEYKDKHGIIGVGLRGYVMPKNRYQDEYKRRIHKVQDYIEMHIGQAMSIEELADVAGFSKYHFSRIFEGVLKEPLAHYVNRIKMEYALFLLAHRKDKNITDISYELGFSDSAVFSRSFKNNYGISPRVYRTEYSKNCKEPFLLSNYNKDAAKKEQTEKLIPVTGKITMETVKEMQVVYVRHNGTYESLEKEYKNLVTELLTAAQRQGFVNKHKNWFLTMYHDNPEFAERTQFRTSLCLTIPDDIPFYEDEVLGCMKLVGGLYAVGHFKIQREQFPDAWNYMYQKWLTCSGYVPRNSYPFEAYFNDPSKSIDHIIEVKIYVPIETIHF